METVDRESVRDSLGSQQASEKSNRITASKAAKLNEDYNREDDFQLKSPYLVQGNAPSKRPESPHTVFSPVDHDPNSFIISKTQKVTNVGDLHQSVLKLSHVVMLNNLFVEARIFKRSIRKRVFGSDIRHEIFALSKPTVKTGV